MVPKRAIYERILYEFVTVVTIGLSSTITEIQTNHNFVTMAIL